MEYFKNYIPFATGMLFALAALNIILLGEYYDVPIFNYLNFPNLLEYTFELVRGLLMFITPIIIFLLWRPTFAKWIDNMKVKWAGIVFVPLLALILCVRFVWYNDLGYWPSRFAIYLVEIEIFVVCILLKKYKADIRIVKVSLFSLFLYGYVKINFQYENLMRDYNKKHKIQVITFKEEKRGAEILRDSTYIITNTVEFVFVYNDKSKQFRAIPMEEIRSISIQPK